jgi:hypothetical protein
MKFYKGSNRTYYWNFIIKNSLTAIYECSDQINFFKNAENHNIKNAAYIYDYQCKQFYLNGKLYGNEDDFTKQSWRKFVKLQVFL